MGVYRHVRHFYMALIFSTTKGQQVECVHKRVKFGIKTQNPLLSIAGFSHGPDIHGDP